MSKSNQITTVKAYGIARHPGFLEIQCFHKQLIEGARITIENQTYQIVSVIEEASGQVSINLLLQSDTRKNPFETHEGIEATAAKGEEDSLDLFFERLSQIDHLKVIEQKSRRGKRESGRF